MDVLIFFCLGIISSILIDQVKSKTIRVSFISLNLVLFMLVVLSSSDPVVVKLVASVLDKDSYEILYGALNKKTSLSLVSYSSYGFLFCFMICELFYSFVTTLIETIRLIKTEIVVLIKRFEKKPQVKMIINTVNKYCVGIYKAQVNASYPMRC